MNLTLRRILCRILGHKWRLDGSTTHANGTTERYEHCRRCPAWRIEGAPTCPHCGRTHQHDRLHLDCQPADQSEDTP